MLMLSVGVQAGYKPPDISDIRGEQRRELEKKAKVIAGFPVISKDVFLGERLGILFRRSQAATARSSDIIHPWTYGDACCVSKKGHVVTLDKGIQACGEEFYTQAGKWEPNLFYFFARDAERPVLNTAGYLLKTISEEHRRMMLASIGKMLYNDEGVYDCGLQDWGMENGINVKAPKDEGRGYVFTDPEGKEHDIRALLEADNKNSKGQNIPYSIIEMYQSYGQTIRLVELCARILGRAEAVKLIPPGSDAISAQFPAEVGSHACRL